MLRSKSYNITLILLNICVFCIVCMYSCHIPYYTTHVGMWFVEGGRFEDRTLPHIKLRDRVGPRAVDQGEIYRL
jgi:hypothetical protein